LLRVGCARVHAIPLLAATAHGPAPQRAGPDAERLVPPAHAGSYLGVIDRLPDIVASGATGVVLSNVFLSSLTAAPPPEPEPEPGSDDPEAAPAVAWPTSEGTLRRPLSFFAPEVALAAGGDPGAAAAQLKALIDALHEAGLEVLLEVTQPGNRAQADVACWWLRPRTVVQHHRLQRRQANVPSRLHPPLSGRVLLHRRGGRRPRRAPAVHGWPGRRHVRAGRRRAPRARRAQHGPDGGAPAGARRAAALGA
jgi:hypothetical protein